jgi:hypothetical protein
MVFEMALKNPLNSTRVKEGMPVWTSFGNSI